MRICRFLKKVSLHQTPKDLSLKIQNIAFFSTFAKQKDDTKG